MDAILMIERLAAALAIGFLIGVERGWKQRKAGGSHRVAGLRTYTLIGLLGGVSGVLGETLGAVAFAALALAFALPWSGYKAVELVTDDDLSITGLVAGLAVFALGALAGLGAIQPAAAAAVALAVILAFKHEQHAWLRGLTSAELRSALWLLAATLIALPLLPDRTIDPFGAINPRVLWLLTVLLAGVSFAGYAALKALGPERGLLVGGLATALVSSTAMTLDLARRTRTGESAPGLAASIAVLGNAVMIGRALILLALFAPASLRLAGPTLGAAATASLAIAAPFVLRAAGRPSSGPAHPGNPLDLKFIARTALMLSAVIILTGLAGRIWGEAGLWAVAALAGLTDVDAITLALAQQMRGELAVRTGVLAVLIAVGANTVSKTGFAAALGRPGFSLPYAAASAAALGAGAAAFLLTPFD